MRTKIATVVAGGILGITGVTLAAPALAAVGADSAATAVDDRVSKIKAALSGLVTDKTLTQAQADKVAQSLADAKIGRGPGGRGGHGGHGGHGGGWRDLSTAATALGMTEADLRTALGSGKSLAAIAKEEGVAVNTLIAKLVAAARTRIAQEVTDGRLTQAQAEEKLATLTARVTERVNSVRPTRPGHEGDRDRDESSTPSTTPSSGATTSSYTPSA